MTHCTRRSFVRAGALAGLEGGRNGRRLAQRRKQPLPSFAQPFQQDVSAQGESGEQERTLHPPGQSAGGEIESPVSAEW